MDLSDTGEVKQTVLYWKSYNGQRAAVRQGDWKFHIDYRAGNNELFNLRVDPGEKQNVIADHPNRVTSLTAVLKEQAKLDRN